MIMKKLLWMAMAFVVLSLASVSCSEKDEFDPENPENIGTTEVGWEENGNTVRFTVKQSWGYGAAYTVTYTCKFNNDGYCIEAIARYEFSSAELAEIFYESYRQMYDEISKSGRTVTVDETEDFEGVTRDELRTLYESMANAY